MEEGLLLTAAKLFSQALIELVTKPALEEAAHYELTEQQFICLRYIYLHGRPSTGQLARGLRLSCGAATRLVDRLIAKRLVLRSESARDRRATELELTQAGRRLVDAVSSVEQEKFGEIIARMTKEEIRHMKAILASFLKSGLTDPELVELVCLKCGVRHDPDCPGNLVYRELTGRENDTI